MGIRYSIILNKDSRKSLLRMDGLISKKIEIVVDELMSNPYLGLKMHGNLSHLRKIRLGNYRIIYEIDEFERIIFIKEIESRGNVSFYK